MLLLVRAAVAGEPSALTDSTDVMISSALRAEPSVFVSPSNPSVLLVTTNTWNPAPWPFFTDPIGATPCWSADAGHNWTCQNFGTGDSLNGGDPACAIGRAGTATPTTGRFYSGYLFNDDLNQISVAYSVDFGSSWTPVPVRFEEGVDRPHLWVNNNPDPADVRRDWLFCAWPNQFNRSIDVMYSINRGVDWTGPEHLWDPVQAADERPNVPNIRVGKRTTGTSPTWNAYVCWSIEPFQPNGDEKGIGFARWREGENPPWLLKKRITTFGSGQPLFVRGTADSGLADNAKYPTPPAPLYGRDLYSPPFMAVDESNGSIYIAWCNRGDPDQNIEAVDRNIYVMRSTDEGDTWSAPVQVNDDVNADPGNPNDQWFPWIGWDDCTGMLVVVFFDTRNHPYGTSNPDHAADVYAATSSDQGLTWFNFKISDGAADYSALSTIPHDYNGIAARNGRAYPVWADDRTRAPGAPPPYAHAVYTSPFYLWAIEQSTITDSLFLLPENVFRLEVTWRTPVPTDAGQDVLELVPPAGIPLDGTFTYSVSGQGRIHTAVYEATCRANPGTWTRVVKSRRSSCVPQYRKRAPKTFKVKYCLD